ncbi:BadF/BadG/BcrA/BcrD ATPase family protein [Lederbergia wuyishanensis]|uniref:N-acetylglucosamine kinase-like BadF-type ATPase n=1 Tax=Lederbergia wuyishanensis TaxID=1347903 RepID=A0ABU0D3S8_9BACI|nr:BadF/BadG/BcrA/BcrD ATPase family protein [Lederbergia wuyishanensis]MCJ8007785.1 ATPase [Lederbergia wuyishanensis]MDQ0343052.1 N-acetylglucosamine kinase-like BadF-type ATPase [Lederbergia wuyishanensis]
MTYTIGIDAGGTKTTGLVIDSDKNILFEIETGFGNPNVNFNEALHNVWEAASACLNSDFGNDCKAIVAGVAGIEAEGNRERFEQFFSNKTKIPAIFVNDAVLAYHALLDDQNGILTIAGTGSISYGRNGEKEGYSGGWGHILGDFGSAYDIAIQVFRQITKEADEGLPYSVLSQALMNKLGINSADGLKGFIYSSPKGEIASITSFVFSEAQKGNEDAKRFFRVAGVQLANQTFSLFKKLDLSLPLKIGIKGSLLEKNPYVKEEFESTLQKLVGSVEFISNDATPAIGANSVAELYKKGA